MNICIATGEYVPQPGGIATFYHALAQILTQGGQAVTVLTSGQAGDSADRGVEVVRLEDEIARHARDVKRSLRGAAPSVIREVATGLAMQAWLAANAQRRGFDIVETPEFGGAGAFLTDLALPPLAVTCHGSYGQMLFYEGGGRSSAKHRVLVGLEALLLGLADVVTACSPAGVQAWTEILQREVAFVPAPWIETAPVDAVAQRRVDAAIVEGIVVGRLQRLKGALELVEAVDLCRQRAVPVCVTWVGRDTPTAPDGGSMLGYIRRCFPEVWGSHFRWIERLSQTETRRAQANADFAVVASHWETLNLTAVEAMSVATPLIISTGAGASYLVQDGASGLVVPARDAVALADAMQRMVTDARLRLRLGCAGQEVIRREFAPERVAAARIAVYEAAIRRRALRRERPYFAPASGLVTELIGLERARANASLVGKAKRVVRAVKQRIQRFQSVFE